MPRVPFSQEVGNGGANVTYPNVYNVQGGTGLQQIGAELEGLARTISAATAPAEAHKAYYDFRTSITPKLVELAKVETDPSKFRRSYDQLFQQEHNARAESMSYVARGMFDRLSYDFGINAFDAGFKQVTENVIVKAKADVNTKLDYDESRIAAGEDVATVWAESNSLLDKMVPVLGYANVQVEKRTRAERLVIEGATTTTGLRLSQNPTQFFQALSEGKVRVPAVLKAGEEVTDILRSPTSTERAKLEEAVYTTLTRQHSVAASNIATAEAARKNNEEVVYRDVVRGIIGGGTKAYDDAVASGTLYGEKLTAANNFMRSLKDWALTSPSRADTAAFGDLLDMLRNDRFAGEVGLQTSPLFQRLNFTQKEQITLKLFEHQEKRRSEGYTRWNAQLGEAKAFLRTKFGVSDLMGSNELSRLGADVINEMDSLSEQAFNQANGQWEGIPSERRPRAIANDLFTRYEKQFTTEIGMAADKIAGRYSVLSDAYGSVSAEAIDNDPRIPADQKGLYKAVVKRYLEQQSAPQGAPAAKPSKSLKENIVDILNALNNLRK